MIPFALVAGLLVGRWAIVPIAAVSWPIILQVTGSCDWSCTGQGLVFAAANAAAGVGVRRLVALVRRAMAA